MRMPIRLLCLITVATMHPHTCTPAAMLGRTTSGLGRTQERGGRDARVERGFRHAGSAYSASGYQQARRTLNAFPFPTVSLW
jgi:hypothetical protein